MVGKGKQAFRIRSKYVPSWHAQHSSTIFSCTQSTSFSLPTITPRGQLVGGLLVTIEAQQTITGTVSVQFLILVIGGETGGGAIEAIGAAGRATGAASGVAYPWTGLTSQQQIWSTSSALVIITKPLVLKRVLKSWLSMPYNPIPLAACGLGTGATTPKVCRVLSYSGVAWMTLSGCMQLMQRLALTCLGMRTTLFGCFWRSKRVGEGVGVGVGALAEGAILIGGITVGAFGARADGPELELEEDEEEEEDEDEEEDDEAEEEEKDEYLEDKVLLLLTIAGSTFAASKAFTVGKLVTDGVEDGLLVLRGPGGLGTTCNCLFAGGV